LHRSGTFAFFGLVLTTFDTTGAVVVAAGVEPGCTRAGGVPSDPSIPVTVAGAITAIGVVKSSRRGRV
jgi:hypothetical protein